MKRSKTVAVSAAFVALAACGRDQREEEGATPWTPGAGSTSQTHVSAGHAVIVTPGSGWRSASTPPARASFFRGGFGSFGRGFAVSTFGG